MISSASGFHRMGSPVDCDKIFVHRLGDRQISAKMAQHEVSGNSQEHS